MYRYHIMETRPFKLSSYDISPSNNLADYYKQTVTTQYGTVADNRMSLTWNNVNLQQIVGNDFYNAYNRFTIKLVNQSWYGAPTSYSGTTYSAQNYQDQFVNVYLKGLPFYPPVYNSPDGALVNTLDTGILSTTVGGTVGRSNVSNSINQTFLKTSTANISINIRCVATEQPYSPADISTYIWGHSVYHFEITGISDVSNVSYIDLSNNTLLNYGQHSIYTELTPTDMTNYFASSNVTNINVLAYTSSISFSATIPTSIVYETNLTNILVTTVGVTQAGVTPEGTTRYYLDNVFTEEIFATTLLNYGSHTIYALFTPNSSDYANSSASTSLIVTQQSSTLTYSTLPSIVYGTTIESSLIASSSAPGTIRYYYDASYTQLVDIADIKNAGTYMIYAIYTSNTNNYSSSSANSSLTIAVASTTLSYEPLSAITYPATIASSLTASSTVEGTVNYYLDSAYTQLVTSTNILNAGTYTLYALFTPSSSNYSSCAANRSITVNKFAPTITLPTIASFVYETTLSDLVTGTTVDISAGTLSFHIGSETGTLLTSSTVLSVGSYTIFCKFTPTYTTNYLSASSTTSLTVTTQSTTIEFSSAIPTSVEYETTLANILNTTSSNAGTVNYYYVSSGANVAVTTSTVLQVGTYTIYAQLIPTNSDYASSTTSTSLTVAHKTVVMTYSNLPNIYYRTTASTSLNATVSPAIAGSFRYFTNVDQTGEVLPATLLNVNNYTIHAYFTPSNSNYTSAYASTSLIVNKFTPIIDLPPSSIVYGTQISSCFIAEISPSSIEGTTTYYMDSNHTDVIESTEVFSVGTYTLYALFTPTNTSNYATASTSETITVTKKPTTLTFPNISSFVYETTLANFITGTTVSGGVPGTFNFFLNNLSGTALSSSTVLETGVYTIFCQFVPTDTTNYSSTTATKSLTVNVLATTIVFSSSIPTTIVYGTTLAQLVNTVVTPNVTGTVRYYTNGNQTTEVFSTTILNVATYTLYAVFTPQMDDYATSSTSTQLSVTKATTTVTYPTLSAIAHGTSMNTSLTAYVSPSMQGVFNYYYVSPFFVNGTNKVSIGANDVLNSGTYTIFVNFVPSNSNYTGSTNSQSLTITTTPTTVIYNTLPNIVYATTLASSLNATIYPNISGTMKYYIDADQVFPTTTLEVGTYSIRATFTPTSNNYVTSTTTKTLTVNKIPTTITFPSVSSIVYQTTLTNIISSTSTGIPGTYSFHLNNATGLELSSATVLEKGTYTIFCKFEPTDSAHYLSSESTKSLVVTGLPTTLAYSPSIVSSIAYETTLANVLNTSVTPSLVGTTVYKIGDTVVTSSTVLAVGTYTITSTFTPTDDDYAQSTVTTALSVTALPTTLSFSIPSSIVYETTMNSSLTATCTKPGTIAYYYNSSYSSVVSGNNVPDVGTYTIYAVFTPSTANYLSSTASASLTVTQRATNIAFSQSIPTTITHETTLNEVLNTSLTSGTTTYYYVNTNSVQVDVSSTTVLSVGTYTIRALFTPSSGNYTTSTATTPLLVSQKPIVVTYSGLPAITYGTTLSSSLNATLSQTVDGTLNYYTDNSLTSSVISTTVLNAGSYTIYAKFTPTSANYVSYVVNTNLTVNKATPIVTYGTLQPIAYGTTLQSSFAASASVGGTIAYFLLNDPIIGSQILNAGTYTLRAQFTPTDATNYESTFATSSLTVSKITPTITFPTNRTLTYETTMSSFISGTTVSVAGSFLFYLANSNVITSSTVLGAGTYAVYCSFSPTDTTNYIQVISSTTVTVQKQSTTVTMSQISTLTSVETLSAFISGTTSSIAGTFNFYINNESGQQLSTSSILSAGTYTIYCIFTPTNSANYLSSTTTKTVTVYSNDTPIIFSSIDTFFYGTTLSSFINGTSTIISGSLSFYINNESGQVLTSSTILNAGTYVIYCKLQPTDTSTYIPSYSTKTLTVQKLTTSITMSLINTFTYGTTMSSFISGTTSSASGVRTFYINDASGQQLTLSTVLNAGTYVIYCKFVPTSSTNYFPSFATKQLIVSQRQITITYGTLSAITYGTTLASRLTATFEPIVDGSMNYYINSTSQVYSTTVLDASAYIITATFTPNSTNYFAISQTSALLVNKVTTIVTYPVLQNVYYNVPIGSASLSATVSPTVDGTLAYFRDGAFTNPINSTTTLSYGVYTLYARFTPTSPNYTVSSAYSSLTVVGITTPTIVFPTMPTVAPYTTLESFITGTSAGVDGTYIFRKNNSTGDILSIASTFSALGPFTIFCSFTPTNTDLYLPSSSTITINVKFTPSFLFNQRPSSTITYGTNLSDTVLTTTLGQFNNTNIPGTITFSNNITTASILLPGIYSIVATFTPTNTTDFNTVTTTKQVLVNKQQLIVMITSPSVKSAFIKSTPIDCSYQIFGLMTNLGDTFENSVSGTIVNKYMTFDESAVLTSSYVYNTTFTGASQTYKIAADIQGFSSTKYTLTPQSYTFTINKYTPTITYTISTANKTLSYGTPLGSNQLNATASYNGIPLTTGSIIYTRSAINMVQTVNSDTELDIGQYNLYAYYSDPINNIYNSVNTSATSTNQITIIKATPTIVYPNIKSILLGTDLANILDYTTATHKSNIVNGTFGFSYVNQSGSTVNITSATILTKPPSSYIITGSFAPTDSTRYNNTTGTITIVLCEQASTLNAVALLQSPITYGKTFNDLYTLNVSPSIAGTYTYYDDVVLVNPASIIDAGTYTYTVIFNPTNTSYAASITDLTFTIANANVSLTYPTPPTYTYQTANQLSLLQPTITPVVDGQLQIFLDASYTIQLTNATPIAVGTHTLYARMTPFKNYNVATVTTPFTVTQIPTSLAQPSKTSSVIYGATNASFLDNSVVGSLVGTLYYYYDNGYTQAVSLSDILDYGTHTIYLKFVNSDTKYANAYGTHTVTVRKSVLSIVYPALPSIQYGTSIGSSLSATSIFDGSINYFINGIEVFSNTQLNSGSYTINAVFTPNNPSNFSTTSVSATRTLIVSKHPTSISYATTNILSGASFGSNMTALVTPNIPGTIRYYNNANNDELLSSTILSSGNYTVFVSFTPTNLSNYTSSSTTAPLTVATGQQLQIFNTNIQYIQAAQNNEVVAVTSQNQLLPETVDVKVNVLTPGISTYTSTITNQEITGLQFNFVDNTIPSNVRIAVSTLTVDLPGASNSPAIYFKFYDETGSSIISSSNRISLTLSLPQFKGMTEYIYLMRLTDIGTGFDGTKVPLVAVNPTDPENITFTSLFTSNSVYVASIIPQSSVEGPLLSNVYTFSATGGFVMERGLDDIKYREETSVETYDVTDSVQVLFDVAFFNAKLGLIKNDSNTQVQSSLFNKISDRFESNTGVIDSVSFSSSEFASGLVKSEQIISVGRYATLYSDFKNYVADYFGFDGGFSSLFTAASEFAIDEDNHFDSESMMSLFTGVSAVSETGSYIRDISGSITIANLTKSLRYAVNTNCFGNRDSTSETAGTASDPANNTNYGVSDGFIAGDLIWVNTGTTVKLSLNIDTEALNPLNNVGPQNTLVQTTNYTSGNFSRETTATTTSIQRVVKAPLLIKLVNASTISSL